MHTSLIYKAQELNKDGLFHNSPFSWSLICYREVMLNRYLDSGVKNGQSLE
ncbi:hypothetical protein GCM10027286_21920 [Virgibacillus ainsalahensis]